MKILITGAEIEKNGNEYEIVYQGRVVFRDKMRDVCIITALNFNRLNELLTGSAAIYKMRVA